MIYIFEGCNRRDRGRVFRQYVEVLSKELSGMGFENKAVFDIDLGGPDDLYIIFDAFGMIRLNKHKELKTDKYIFYNTERSKYAYYWADTEKTKVANYTDMAIPVYQKALAVWCHNKGDAEMFNKHSINATYFPFGYSKYFKVIDKSIAFHERNKIAIWLCLTESGRRKRWSDKLNRIKKIGNCWTNDNYIEMVSEYGLFINIHQSDTTDYSEPFRVLPLLCNNCLTISEKSSDDLDMERLVIQVDDPEQMNEKINYYLDHPEETEELIKEKLEWFQTNFSFQQNFIKSGCLETIQSYVNNIT